MSNKKVSIPLAVLATVALLLVVLEKVNVTNFVASRPQPTSSQGPTSAEKQQEADTNAAVKKQVIEDKASDTPNNSTTPASNKAIDLSTKQESNNTVTIYTKLTGYGDGNCDLKIINSSKSVTQTAPVIYQPEFASCAGFSVPIDSVGKGTWSLTLTVNSGGISASKTISSEVR